MRFKTFHFKSLTSTQDKAKEFAKKGQSDIIVVSDVQTKGRGRFKRKWHSPRGGLWMSVLIKPRKAENMQYLTFAAAVSVVNAIKKISNLKASIKWPNDVHYKGRKLCGILTEGIFGKENCVVVGFGINVNQAKFPDEIKSTATSLRMLKHGVFNIKNVENSVLEEFLTMYNNYYNKNKLKKILDLWKTVCDTLGRNVKVISRNKILKGRVVGGDENCNLLVKSKNNIFKVLEGDVSIRY